MTPCFTARALPIKLSFLGVPFRLSKSSKVGMFLFIVLMNWAMKDVSSSGSISILQDVWPISIDFIFTPVEVIEAPRFPSLLLWLGTEMSCLNHYSTATGIAFIYLVLMVIMCIIGCYAIYYFTCSISQTMSQNLIPHFFCTDVDLSSMVSYRRMDRYRLRKFSFLTEAMSLAVKAQPKFGWFTCTKLGGQFPVLAGKQHQYCFELLHEQIFHFWAQ